MNKKAFDIPVTLIFFNRPDTTARVFEKIKAAAPEKLYLVSDAPRSGNADDEKKVSECRRLVEDGIDWHCEVVKLYADTNMGCKRRVYTGIGEVLKKEEWTVILEDDVVPSEDFFPFCREMLIRYRDDRRVMMVSGTNLVKHRMKGPYCFSCFSSIWGWATWARAWEKYDPDVTDWPELKQSGFMKGIQGGGFAYLFLKNNIEQVYTKKKDTWDIQWDYCRHKNHGLGIVPAVNMIDNIGFGREDATHTTWDATEDFSYGKMKFPLDFVPVSRDEKYDRSYIRKYFGWRKLVDYVMKRVRKHLGS